ncbi:MAG: hypothetical protein ACNI27_13005 [Desulfovibrio sp.]
MEKISKPARAELNRRLFAIIGLAYILFDRIANRLPCSCGGRSLLQPVQNGGWMVSCCSEGCNRKTLHSDVAKAVFAWNMAVMKERSIGIEGSANHA